MTQDKMKIFIGFFSKVPTNCSAYCHKFYVYFEFLSVTTEVWNFEMKTSRTYNSFKSTEYWNPILFLVDPNFCIWSLYNKQKTKYFLIVSECHIPPYPSIQLNDSRVMERVFCEISKYFRCGLKRGKLVWTVAAMSVTGVGDKK